MKGSGSTSRLSFIHNPSSEDTNPLTPHRHISPIISHLITHDLLSKVSLEEFGVLLSPESASFTNEESSTGQLVLSENSVVYQLLQDVGISMDRLSDSETHERYALFSKLFVRELGIAPGELVLVVNGRVSLILL